MTPSSPWLVIITGPPAAGKTVLAKRLAEDLRLPLFTKDGFKETLFDSLGYGEDAWSRRLGGAAYDLLFCAAGSLLWAHRACIIEANFDVVGSLHSFECLQAKAPYRPLQIVCRARPETLASRYKARHASGERHPGHHGEELVDPVNLLRRHGPLTLDGPVLVVDNESEQSQAINPLWSGQVVSAIGSIPDGRPCALTPFPCGSWSSRCWPKVHDRIGRIECIQVRAEFGEAAADAAYIPLLERAGNKKHDTREAAARQAPAVKHGRDGVDIECDKCQIGIESGRQDLLVPRVKEIAVVPRGEMDDRAGWSQPLHGSNYRGGYMRVKNKAAHPQARSLFDASFSKENTFKPGSRARRSSSVTESFAWTAAATASEWSSA